MAKPGQPYSWARFDDVEIDLKAAELHRQGRRVRLQNQPFQLLVFLLEHSGDVVTQDAIRATLWPSDTVVEFDLSIGTAVKQLRHALGDDASTPRYIETLPRRGYRWLVPVTWAHARGTAASAGPRPAADGQDAVVELAGTGREHLVGRAASLELLHASLERALHHERQLVFVTGEPGIGKTALVDEFQRQAAPAVRGRIVRGQCIERYGSQEPYYPVLEALGQLCRGSRGGPIVEVLAAHAPTWLVQFPALLTKEHRELLQREILGATRERMLREIAEALESITADEPLLLVFEDLQWVDPATVDLLAVLARRRGPAQLLIVATKRPVDAPPSDPLRTLEQDLTIHQLCREIALQPLSDADIAEYLAAASSSVEEPEGLGAVLYRHSEGNPLFMRAALEHLTERGFIARESGGWRLLRPLTDIHLGVPERLRNLIEAQVERHSAAEQRTLEVASVAGATFSADLIGAAGDLTLEAAEEMCNDLARRGHLVRAIGFQQFPGGTVSPRYQFVHALYREVLYDRLGPARRARLHVRVGERLEALSGDAASVLASELADHFERGSDWQRAVKYLRLAADASRRYFAQREAIAVLRRALGLVHHLPETERAQSELAILETLATTHVVAFDIDQFDATLETYHTLADRAAHYGAVDVEVRALVDQAFPLSWVSSERCLDALERARRLGARHPDPLMRTRVRASCACWRIWADGWDARAAEDARAAVAEIRKTGNRAVLAEHVGEFGMIYQASSRYREGHRSACEARAILTEESAENPHMTLAYVTSGFIASWCLTHLGRFGEAVRETTAAIEIMERNGDYYRAKTMQLFLATTHLYALDFAGVLAMCKSVASSVGHPARTIERRMYLALAGLAETALASYASALERFARAQEEMDRYGVIFSWHVRLMVEQGVTDCLLASGDLARARAQAERFLAMTLATADRMFQALAWEANARLEIAEGDLVRAAHCIDEAVATVEGFEVPLAAWRVHATGAERSERAGDGRAAKRHRKLSRATILELAESLSAEESMRTTFLSAPAVRAVLER